MKKTKTLIIFLVIGLIAFSIQTTSADEPLPTSEYEYWEIRQLSSHTSYDEDGYKCDLEVQADAGIRSFEFDLHNERQPWLGTGAYDHSVWGVYHTWGSQGEYCGTLSECADKLMRWHYANPEHEVITL